MMKQIDKIGAAFDAFMYKHWIEVCGVIFICALGFFLVVLVVE